MAPLVCQKCGKEIQSGKERLLSEEDMMVIREAGPLQAGPVQTRNRS